MKNLIYSLTLVVSLIIVFFNTLFAQWTLQGIVPEVGSYPANSVFSPT